MQDAKNLLLIGGLALLAFSLKPKAANAAPKSTVPTVTAFPPVAQPALAQPMQTPSVQQPSPTPAQTAQPYATVPDNSDARFDYLFQVAAAQTTGALTTILKDAGQAYANKAISFADYDSITRAVNSRYGQLTGAAPQGPNAIQRYLNGEAVSDGQLRDADPTLWNQFSNALGPAVAAWAAQNNIDLSQVGWDARVKTQVVAFTDQFKRDFYSTHTSVATMSERQVTTVFPMMRAS